MSEQQRTVFIVDDDQAVREGLELLLASVGLEFESFDSATAFLEAYDPGRAGCLLLDIRMPGMSGLDLQARLTDMQVKLPLIFLTGHGDIALAVRAMRAGAFHFFEKPFNDQDLLDRIHLALEHEARDREERRRRERLLDRTTRLTDREREVMGLVVAGHANKVIADDLGISERTVEIHRARVMEKMEASSLAHLVRMSVELGSEPG